MISRFEEFLHSLKDYNVEYSIFNGKTVLRISVTISMKVDLISNYKMRTYYNGDKTFKKAWLEFESIQKEIRSITTVYKNLLELRTRSSKKREKALNNMINEIKCAIKSFEEKRPVITYEINKLQGMQRFLLGIMHQKLSDKYKLNKELKKMEKRLLIQGSFEGVRDDMLKKFFELNGVTVLDKSNELKAVLFAQIHRENIDGDWADPYKSWDWVIDKLILAGLDEDGTYQYEIEPPTNSFPIDLKVEDVFASWLQVKEVRGLIKQGNLLFTEFDQDIVEATTKVTSVLIDGRHLLISVSPFELKSEYIKTGNDEVIVIHKQYKKRHLKPNTLYKYSFITL